tara:strand:+ start:478 stop:822 length:345 start_codon:yes stop_codon:yes gene_type:complete
MDTFYLKKSTRKDKKYVMEMPKYNHKHHFGAKGMRDFTLINNKKSKFYLADKDKRDKVKKAYKARHGGDKGLGNIHSPAELSDVLLWTAPTLQGGIKNYEKRHNVNVIKKFNFM